MSTPRHRRSRHAGRRASSAGVRRRLGLAAAIVACGVAGAGLAASPASAGTWYITPTATNHSDGLMYQVQYGVNDGDWLTTPSATLAPGANNTYEFDAPHLDEGADATVAYNMADTTQMVTLSQDDVNGGFTNELASPTCALPDPTGPWPQYACAAGFGNQGTFNPSNSNFTPKFDFFNNGESAPSGATPAPFTAAGQECNAQMTSGSSSTCTNAQPSLTGFSPVDPNNYEILTVFNQGQYPVTITITDPYYQSLYAQNKYGCLFDWTDDPDEYNCLPATESWTLPAWSKTHSLLTFGGANTDLYFNTVGRNPALRSQARPHYAPPVPPLIHQGAVSDQISISPGPGAPAGASWYGVQIYVQSEIGPAVQDGESLLDLLAGLWTAFESTYNSALYENDGGEEAVPAGASVRPGASLPSGHSIASGPYRLLMRATGNLVEDVRVNRHRFVVWSSDTKAKGSRLVLQRDGNLVIRDRGGGLRWSTHTHGTRVASLDLQSNGSLVLRARTHRALFATGPVSFPFRAWPGATSLSPEMGLGPGDELHVGTTRLRMGLDGDLALLRRGQRRWRSKTRGHPGAYAELRHGNLAVRTPHGKILWSTHTGGRGQRLVVTRAGTLVLYSRSRRRLWSAPTRSERHQSVPLH
jgi:hypothetical protein